MHLYNILVLCLSSSPVHFKKGPEYLTRWTRCLSFWWDFCCWTWFRVVFSFVWGTFLLFFLSSPLVWWSPFPLFPSTCIFLFSERFGSFLIQYFYSFRYLSFFYFSLWAWQIFLCQIPFLFHNWMFLLFVPESSVIFNILQTAWCRDS